MFFEDWDGIIRIAVTAPLAYFALLAMIHLSGNRTLAKMTSYDFIVTVALGSTIATIVLDKGVPLLNGIAALLSFILLQYIVSWLSVRFTAMNRLFHSEPQLLMHEGRLLYKTMRKCRVTENDILQALRDSGLLEIKQAKHIILESNGEFSIIPQKDAN